MIKIKSEDTIPYGVYAGMRLGSVVKKFGRRVLLEIVKCNEVDDDYLKRYHYHHPATEEEKKAWEEKKKQLNLSQEGTCESTHVEEPYVTTFTKTECQDQEESFDYSCWEDFVLYDPEDDPEDSSCHYSPLEWWENYPLGEELIGYDRMFSY